jgi:uncharacterized protein YegP (UPF0339 family)
MIRRTLLGLVLALASAGFASAAPMTFEIYADNAGDFRWRLKDGETNVANSGQGYKDKRSCATIVENFKADISKYEFELYEDNKKETRFRLKAKNGNVVGASTAGYKAKADAEKVVEAIRKGAKDAKVDDQTKK